MSKHEFESFSQTLSGDRWEARQRLGFRDFLGDRAPETPDEVFESWPSAIDLREASEGSPGLRRPQSGAVHSLLGYWTTDPRMPATVVMPTGTGKTDTMIAAFVAGGIRKLLVIVPSDALRDQIAEKFESMGVLRVLGMLDAGVSNPVVGRLRGALQGFDDAQAIVQGCNVVVTTPPALLSSTELVRQRFMAGFTHLFIDEAHHVAAPTWRTIRDAFLPRPVVQFTATPHRTDGDHLGGTLVYVFPLREAQRENYFSTIGYLPVLDLLDPDGAVAEAAVAQLRKDREAGFDHIIMARANSIVRAEVIAEIYRELCPEFSPVLVHSRTPKFAKRAAIDNIRANNSGERESRVLVCVDMFGEGFDLPQLKIAAMHDQHRSLGITLQFVGRFARGGVLGLGPATVIAAQTDYRHTDALRRLYAEDADWNDIVEDLSRAAVDEQIELGEFVKGFNHDPDGVSIHSITPAMSTVVYRTPALTWSPEGLADLYDEDDLLTFPIPVSQRDRVAWFVIRRIARIRWGTIDGVETVEHHLFVVYWDADRGLLYINSSDNGSVHEEIAEALLGNDPQLIQGSLIYRVFHKVERLTPTNVGLLDTRSRARRYTSYTGSDVTDAFPTVEKQTKSQTHIAGAGFLDGVPYSIAGSRKGRVWSHRTAPGIKEWTTWCDTIGGKLLDDTISVESLIAGFIKPESIERWPALTVLAVEATPALHESLAAASLSYRDVDVPWACVEVSVVPHVAESQLDFTLKTDEWEVSYEILLNASGLTCRPKNKDEDVVVKRERSTTTFAALATKRGLLVCLEQDAIVEPPGVLLKPDRELQPYQISSDAQINWEGINIRKESWGANRDAATVQGRIVELTRDGTWDVIIDDDGPGEIADVVAVREIDGALVVHLVHCKFSHADTAGARISDLYEVCGQAIKSARWRRDPEEMLRQLMRRERERLRKKRPSGFVEGDASALHRLIQRAHLLHPRYTIAIAQPGLSASGASKMQLELLASVEVYVVETSAASFSVYCSA